MSCAPCSALRQVAANAAILLDQALNFVLLGNPRETISERTARARQAGSKGAARACRIVTWTANRLGFAGDHCDWALDREGGSSASELWDWTPARSKAGQTNE